MATLEERVAYLEGRLEDHASTVIDVRTGLSNLDVKVESVESKLAAKIETVESRLTARIDGVESRLTARIDGVEGRITEKIDRHFTWLVGIEITVLLALISALLRR